MQLFDQLAVPPSADARHFNFCRTQYAVGPPKSQPPDSLRVVAGGSSPCGVAPLATWSETLLKIARNRHGMIK